MTVPNANFFLENLPFNQEEILISSTQLHALAKIVREEAPTIKQLFFFSAHNHNILTDLMSYVTKKEKHLWL